MGLDSDEFYFEPFEDAHDWVVVRAKPEPGRTEIKKGFPFLVDKNTRVICEPVLLFVHETYVQGFAKAEVVNTCLAYTHDGKDWMRYLEEFGMSWLDVQLDDLLTYVRIMDTTYSTRGKLYAISTINRRSMFVLLFYYWASKYFEAPVGEGNYLLNVEPLLDRTQKRIKAVKLPEREEDDVPVKPLTRAQAKLLLDAIGPTPEEWTALVECEMRCNPPSKVRVSGRDRLACETALKTGLRVSGTCSLKVSHFSRFKATPLSPRKNYVIKIREKGKLRDVKFSGELISQILLYIENERAYIVSHCERDCGDGLFLNSLATEHAGGRVSVRTLERAMSMACFKVGLTEMETHTDFEWGPDGSMVEVSTQKMVASFVFHQLRHTFAIWLYYVLKNTGQGEPWLIVQARLGHSSLRVTLETYLRAVDGFEADVSDAYMGMFFDGTN